MRVCMYMYVYVCTYVCDLCNVCNLCNVCMYVCSQERGGGAISGGSKVAPVSFCRQICGRYLGFAYIAILCCRCDYNHFSLWAKPQYFECKY